MLSLLWWLTACGAVPNAAPTGDANATASLAADSRRVVGYFTQWGIYGVNYQVSDVPATKLTHLNYAFSNIAGGKCISGDTYADFDHTKGGVPADWNAGALRGNAMGLKLLKQKNPNLKVLISVGGWTWSGQFSTVAASDASRKTFVGSCIDLWIKGQFPGVDPKNGVGIFDGIDIDWEYPVSGGLPGNAYNPADRQNYTLLMQEFRTQLNALSSSTGKSYLLTIASGASPDLLANKQETQKLAGVLDWINLMSYDYHGSFEGTTNFHSGLLRADGDPQASSGFYSDGSIAKMLELGVPAGKISLGVGFYGRGWGNVGATNNGLYQPGSPVNGNRDDGSSGPTGVFTYDYIVSSLEPGSSKFRHPQSKQVYLYNASTRIWLAYDDPQSMLDKIAYVKSKGLGGIMFWELSQDKGTLLEVISANIGGGGTNPPPPPPPPPTGPVCFFENPDYQGASVCGSGDNTWIGTALNDKISSVKVSSGYQTTLFSDINFGGSSVTLSANTANLSGVNFDNLLSSYKISQGSGGDTTPPTVSLSSSASNVTAAATITLSAQASDNVGVSRVEFFDNGLSIGTDSAAPYSQSVALTSAKNGTRAYTAKAFDAAGNSATSAVVSVTVNIGGVTGNAQAWAANVAYKVGDKVSYAGKLYSCRQAHTSLVGWEPPNVPALWLLEGDAATNPPPPPGPTPPPPPGPTPPPPPSNGLAKHALVGYWHNFSNPSGATFPLSQVSSDWDVILIAFGDNAGNGNVSFTLDGGAGGEAQFIADVAAKRVQGKKVVLSLGGQNGSVTVGNQSDADNFANSLAAIIKKYGFDGIDLDLESGSGVSQGTPIQTFLPIAVKSLKSKLGGTMYLSMAPEWPYVEGAYTAFGGIWGAYIPIIDALRGELTLLHPQYYNNGAVFTPYSTAGLAAGSTDQLVATARMLIEGFPYANNTKSFAGLRPDQVGFGVPSGPSSANSGFTTPANVSNALECLTRLVNCGSIRPNQAYPSFRGVMTWSINWDKFDGFNFSRPVAQKLRSLP
jgi:chitinase